MKHELHKLIAIVKRGLTAAHLIPVERSCRQRIGVMKGKLVPPQSFDAPLPDEMIDAFEDSPQILFQ